jgi:FG-GAP repeat
MLFGKRGSRPSKAGRKKEAFRPRGENLEAKVLMAFDLGAATPPALPNIATGNVGIDMAGATAGQNAGTSVANLGDVNGTGYDSFLIGAPTGANPAVYLVFGSQNQASTGAPTTLDWLNTTNVTNVLSNGRVGSLGTLGTTDQTNPITGVAGTPPNGYSFAGIKFIASASGSSLLGASVADAGVINGTQAFLIGAPNALDAAGDATSTGSGRVYLVYGSTNLLGLSGQTIDLDNPTATSGVSIVTYATSVIGSRLGSSVAGIGNFLNDGSNNIAMGAMNATVGSTGATPNTGAVYVVSANGIPTSTNTTPIDVSKFGQPGGTSGLVLAGAGGGNQAGFSVAGAGDVNGDGLGDLLIGAPAAAGGNGTTYLVYGGNLGGQVINNFNYNFISLARVGQPTGSTPAPVPGAAISGAGGTGGERAGYAVYSAGDFNSDGVADIMIGSPNFSSPVSSNLGRVTILYGGKNNLINGVFTLNTIPSGIDSLMLIGNAGDQAGFSLGYVAPINSGQTNEVLIGAPGNSLAYLLPGHGGTFTGVFDLTDAENPASLAGVQFTATAPSFGSTGFGTSVSGRLVTSGQVHTADSDLVGDFIIGAPNYAISSSTTNAGGAFIVQGAMITLGIPPATNVITTTITRIDSSTTSPFLVNPKTPDTMLIYVTNSTTPTGQPFIAATDIDPTTITVNGVAFPNATVAADPNNANQAIITISPRSSLNLPTGNSTLVVTGKTLASSTIGVQNFQAKAAITGGGGGGGGGGAVSGGVAAQVPPGAFTPINYLNQFGGSFVPSVSSMSQYNYAPLPMSVALSQYLPPAGFRQRIQAFHGQKVQGRRQNASRKNDTGTGVWTLGRSVYNRSRFHNGNTYTWIHSGLVVPNTRKVQKFSSAGNKLPG